MVKFNWTESEFREYDSENAGFCLDCGALHYGVEPDASGYTCDECDSKAVMGAAEILIRGKVSLIDEISEDDALDIAESVLEIH